MSKRILPIQKYVFKLDYCISSETVLFNKVAKVYLFKLGVALYLWGGHTFIHQCKGDMLLQNLRSLDISNVD